MNTAKSQCTPVLDPDFLPAVLWNRAYLTDGGEQPPPLSVAVLRADGTGERHDTIILPTDSDATLKQVERLVKFLLWKAGGTQVLISDQGLTDQVAAIYCPTGERAFDAEFMERIFDSPFSVRHVALDSFPDPSSSAVSGGGYTNGCRVGFDLGGSDRKCAAVIDGDVIFSEEIKWRPYFNSNPDYHIEGIRDSIRRAAEHLPRVDAIGGSAAGVYVDNEARAASLFRGISPEDFEQHIRPLFHNLQREWDVPFDVANDGEITALAGALSLGQTGVLGISMGTSTAAGYVTQEGHITQNLNELAFVPVDYRDDAPADEWSGDLGCAVQYFSQQAVARLAKSANLGLAEDMPFDEQLEEVQARVQAGDETAADIFRTIGTYFGYSLAHFSSFYEFNHVLLLGRVTGGRGGDLIIEHAQEVLKNEFPERHATLSITTPDERMKRHGQAVAAAGLPALERT